MFRKQRADPLKQCAPAIAAYMRGSAFTNHHPRQANLNSSPNKLRMNVGPNALNVTLNAWDTYHRLGTPEGELVVAQAVVYLACCPKSNSVYSAFNLAIEDARLHGSLEVPMHLRNAPTRMMKDLGYGANYRYAHDEQDGYAHGETYFPSGMERKNYYKPVERGVEKRIKEYMEKLRRQDKSAAS